MFFNPEGSIVFSGNVAIMGKTTLSETLNVYGDLIAAGGMNIDSTLFVDTIIPEQGDTLCCTTGISITDSHELRSNLIKPAAIYNCMLTDEQRPLSFRATSLDQATFTLQVPLQYMV